jgi:hypothetical protein
VLNSEAVATLALLNVTFSVFVWQWFFEWWVVFKVVFLKKIKNNNMEASELI